MTEPPGPPLPPSGPPRGLNFSRCTEATPLPPRPALTCSVTRSTKVGTAMGWCSCRGASELLHEIAKGAPEGRPSSCRVDDSGVVTRDDVDDPAAAAGAELDGTGHQGEQRVVATATYAGTRVEVGAALPHDDLAGADDLAAVAL